MNIQILSPDVVAKIAAGEVVERPSSVVKELVENSLDAGARRISVEVVAGGCDLIQVADDGRGIPRDELGLAVARHATSKIRSVEDLNATATLGFRGEALASIAAVSELTLASRPASSPAAHQLRVRGGELLDVSPVARAPGTTVTVERLFFNVPARRKFLRSAASESSQVAHLLSQFALAYPEVAFQLTVDGRRSLTTSGGGDFLEAAVAVLGREVVPALLSLEATLQTDLSPRSVVARLSGYVAAPTVSRATRTGIWLFVNRRPVRSRTLVHAVESGYQTLLQAGRFPIAVVNLQVPPTEVDVNVHPAKAEVRLLRERLIYGGLRDAVHRVVGGDAPWGKEVDHFSPAPWDADQREAPSSPPRLIDAPLSAAPSGAAEDAMAGGRRLPILRLIGQVAQTYIVAEGERGLYLIDQHAAHERVLYGRLMKAMGQEGNTQLLLEPVSLELTPEHWDLAVAAASALEALGYRLEPFGERTLLVRGIPSELPHGQAIQVLQESLSDISEEGAETDWRERMAVALSCRGAVKAGQSLSAEEMRALVEALEESDITQHCSHGRPTAILLSHSRLEREFGRH